MIPDIKNENDLRRLAGIPIKEDPIDKRSRNNEFTLKTYRFPFQKMMPK